MFQAISLSDTDITQVFLQRDNNIEHIFSMIEYVQIQLDKTLDTMTNQENGDDFVYALAPTSFAYCLLHEQINQLFQQIEERYEKDGGQELMTLLKKCGHLRSTAYSVYSLLQQTKFRESEPTPHLSNQHLDAAVQATIQHYGGKA